MHELDSELTRRALMKCELRRQQERKRQELVTLREVSQEKVRIKVNNNQVQEIEKQFIVKKAKNGIDFLNHVLHAMQCDENMRTVKLGDEVFYQLYNGICGKDAAFATCTDKGTSSEVYMRQHTAIRKVLPGKNSSGPVEDKAHHRRLLVTKTHANLYYYIERWLTEREEAENEDSNTIIITTKASSKTIYITILSPCGEYYSSKRAYYTFNFVLSEDDLRSRTNLMNLSEYADLAKTSNITRKYMDKNTLKRIEGIDRMLVACSKPN